MRRKIAVWTPRETAWNTIMATGGSRGADVPAEPVRAGRGIRAGIQAARPFGKIVGTGAGSSAVLDDLEILRAPGLIEYR